VIFSCTDIEEEIFPSRAQPLTDLARRCGVSALAAQTAMVMATITSARMALARIQSKLRISKPQFLNLIRKSDLAAVGHGLELPAFFPRFLLVPRDGGSAMIVWIADEGCLLLCCA
jgi:hypothetical protein